MCSLAMKGQSSPGSTKPGDGVSRLTELNDGVWITLSDFLDVKSLGRVGSSSAVLAAKQFAVERAVSDIEKNAPGAFVFAAKLRRVLAGKHIHAGHVTSLLSRPHWHVRTAVLEALSDVGKDASAPHFDAIGELLQDSDAQVRRAALRLLRRFAPRTSVFAARVAALLDETAAETEAQRSLIQEAFIALPEFGIHAILYSEQIKKARRVLVWSAEVEEACVAFAELGISFVPSLTACLKNKFEPTMVRYSVRHGRCRDEFYVCSPQGIYPGAEVQAFAIFEDSHGFMPHSLVHRDVSFKWSAWRSIISKQTDSSFTLAEGRRRRFAKESEMCLEEYTISSGGYDVSCRSFDILKSPSKSETVMSMAKLNLERLDSYGRFGWSTYQRHIATCCEALGAIVSDSDMHETRLMLEGCSCGFCASVLEVTA
jgi:hypothetical protein